MLILSCAVTEVAWITDEVWIIDEPFAVGMRGEFLHDQFFLVFPVICLSLYVSYLNYFFKVETWSCSWALNLSKKIAVLMLPVSIVIEENQIQMFLKVRF